MTWDIRDKQVLITGGTSGIGRATAAELARRGASVRRMGVAMTLLKPFLSTPEKGAATSVHLATAQDAELDLGIYWSGRKPKQPSEQALDGDAALQLWDLSAELVGLST